MGIEAIELELNRLYIVDKDKYKAECDDWKSKGYKIYRDSKGRHRVYEPPKNDTPKPRVGTKELKELFGDIFGDAFDEFE